MVVSGGIRVLRLWKAPVMRIVFASIGAHGHLYPCT